MSLVSDFARHLAGLELPAGKAVVAVSGGADSVALLGLLVETRDDHGLDLIAAHADHGIQPGSAAVAKQVRALAETLGVPFETTRLSLGAGAGETRARAGRYAWLETLRARTGAELVFTAHHADDQSETVLMRLLAGSGPAGLAGIAPRRGHLVRPLLPWTHADLVDWVRERGWPVAEDPANRDPRHLRSWVRTEILPRVRERLPDVDRRLRRAARQARLARSAWDMVLDRLPDLAWQREIDGASVAVAPLAGYDTVLGAAVLMAALRRAGGMMGPLRAGRLFAFVQRSGSGRRADLGGGWWAELAFGRLHFVRDADCPEPGGIVSLHGPAGEVRWGAWQLRWSTGRVPATQAREGASAWFTPGPLTLRPWLAGERMQPLRGTGHRLVVRCLQEARVPRRHRPGWPVVERAGTILWLPRVARGAEGVPEAGAEGVRVDASFG